MTRLSVLTVAFFLFALALPLLAITRKVRIYNEQSGSKMEIAFKFKWNSTHGQVMVVRRARSL